MAYADKDLVIVCPYCADRNIPCVGYEKIVGGADIGKMYFIKYTCGNCNVTFLIEKEEDFDW